MKRFSNKKDRKTREPKASRKPPVPKAREHDTQTDYVGYNDPPAEAERIQDDLHTETKTDTKDTGTKDTPSAGFSKEDLPERIDDDRGPESIDDDGRTAHKWTVL